MSLVILFGPHAVGKMTVGQALADQTGLRLFHNHMSIELARRFFGYDTPEGRALVEKIRREVFDAVAGSDLPGMIFTYVWAFELPQEFDYIVRIARRFSDAGHRVCWVELEADFEVRLGRNTTPNRLAEKPSKRDVEWSDREMRASAEKHRLNSNPGELMFEHYMRIDNTELPPEEVARKIAERFGL